MKLVSELIKELIKAKEKYGDMLIEIRDVNNGESYFDVSFYEDHATESELKEGVDGTFVIEFYMD